MEAEDVQKRESERDGDVDQFGGVKKRGAVGSRSVSDKRI
jgi:hypothetical protein